MGLKLLLFRLAAAFHLLVALAVLTLGLALRFADRRLQPYLTTLFASASSGDVVLDPEAGAQAALLTAPLRLLAGLYVLLAVLAVAVHRGTLPGRLLRLLFLLAACGALLPPLLTAALSAAVSALSANGAAAAAAVVGAPEFAQQPEPELRAMMGSAWRAALLGAPQYVCPLQRALRCNGLFDGDCADAGDGGEVCEVCGRARAQENSRGCVGEAVRAAGRASARVGWLAATLAAALVADVLVSCCARVHTAEVVFDGRRTGVRVKDD